MPLPHEAEVAHDIRMQHGSALQEMEQLLEVLVGLVDEKTITITKGRGLDRYVVAISMALFTKACKTHRAIQQLCMAGLTSDADALLRVLFETVVALCFILKKHSRVRARLFGVFGTVQTVKALRTWARTKGMKRSGKQLVTKAETALRDRSAELGKLLSQIPRTHRFDPRLQPAATAFRQARSDTARRTALTNLTDSVYTALKTHWSGEGLEGAAKNVGLGQIYQSLYRQTSQSAHGADFVSHLGLPDEGDDSIVINLSPDGKEVPRVSTSANLLLWISAKQLNHRFGMGVDARIAAAEPQTIKSRRLLRSKV